MRKIAIILFLIVHIGLLAAETDKKLAIRLGAGGLLPADSGYRAIYGKSAFMPRIELAYTFSPGLSAWTGFGWLKKSGQGPDSGIACDSSQYFLAAGPAYSTPLSKILAVRLAAGPLLVFYREKAGSWTVSGTTLGADINAALAWAISPALALEGRLGYLLASDRIDGGDTFKMGGLWAGLGLALNL